MNRSRIPRIIPALLPLVLMAFSAPAGAQVVPASDAENTGLWFVELKSPPAADGTARAALRAEQRAFESAARAAGVNYQRRYVFETLWNGYSVRVSDADLAKLSRMPEVANLFPVMPISLPEPGNDPLPDLFTALSMTGAEAAQSAGFTGAGVKIGIIDTGVDYDHPDLGGGFGPGYRVIAGYDFVGDAYNANPSSPTYNPVPVPDDDPDDCGGHGTHVAGIAAANGAVTGVAPDALIGAYRVFGCEGSTEGDIMIAAMERALADGMQVVNMSIGSAFQWPQYPTAMAADRLVNKGVVVVCSIGNSGANGLYSAGAPGLGKHVIGTASVDNTNVVLPYFEVNGAPIGYQTMAYSAPPPTSGTEEIVYVGRACDADLPLLANPAGKAALIVRGTCSFAEKAQNAIDAGATAVVIYNNVPGGVINGTLGAPLGSDVPVVGISQADGLFIQAQTAPVTMTWTDQLGSFPAPNGGLISSFSSYGLAPDLSLKPDIAAPGGNIYSTYPLELGGYATMGGTSMASPHVAGTAALLLGAYPKTPAKVVRSILQNNANPIMWWGNPGLGFLDNVHRQGAGVVQIDDAIAAMARVEPGKLSLGEGEAGPTTHMLTIENKASTPVTYDLSYVNALSTGGVIAPSFFLSNASVSFGSPSVTVPADGEAMVSATITPATFPTYGQYGGYIMFTPQGGGQVLRVPYAGFVDDYQSIQVLVPTGNDFPWLARLVGASYVKQSAGATFTMEGDDIPFLLIHLEHQSRRLRVEVFDAAKGKAWHRAYNEEYMPRNSTATSFFAFPFDGITVIGNGKGTKWIEVPDGTYVLKLSVLKALGDDSNPAHWETWTSPEFVIDRP